MEPTRRRRVIARFALGVLLFVVGLTKLLVGSEGQRGYGVVMTVLGIGNAGIALYQLRSEGWGERLLGRFAARTLDRDGFAILREVHRGGQPTISFDDYLAHWDDKLVGTYARHVEGLRGVRRADMIDREVVELIAPLVSVFVLRRDAKRWVQAYTTAHPM